MCRQSWWLERCNSYIRGATHWQVAGVRKSRADFVYVYKGCALALVASHRLFTAEVRVQYACSPCRTSVARPSCPPRIPDGGADVAVGIIWLCSYHRGHPVVSLYLLFQQVFTSYGQHLWLSNKFSNNNKFCLFVFGATAPSGPGPPNSRGL
jgi:hypothetical protein